MVVRQDDSELIARYMATHEAGLREEIILRFIPLVHFVLGRLGINQSLGQDYEDAVSQGILGLIESLERFDPAHGTQFSTYATLRIRGKVIDYLRSHDWLSRGARQRTRLVQQAIETLWRKFQRAPTDEELASHLNIDITKLRQALIDSSHVIVSLDSVLVNDSDEIANLYEILPDEKQASPSEVYDIHELKDVLIEYLKLLPEREQLVLSLYYAEELTFKEIGAVLDVSESRVCQLHARAIMSLRSRLRKDTFEYENQTHFDPGVETHQVFGEYNQGNASIPGGYRR
jgi:RNA polymerase sigma factor for flagellar operon FliA